MKVIRKLTNFNISGFHQKVKRVESLSHRYHLVKSFSDKDSWGFINWRFKVVQGLRDYLGHYPDILKKQGKLKVRGTLTRNSCDNSPKRENKKGKKTKEVSLQDKLARAEKRIAYSKRCGAKGHVAVMLDVLTNNSVVAYLPIHCHSVFCPRCASEWSREVKNRILSAFENEKEVHFITLTIPNRECKSFEETYDAVNDIMSYLTKLYDIKLTDKFLSRLDEAFKQECKSLYENVKKKHGRKEARKSVANQVKHYRAFIPILRSFKGYKLGQVINAVWRLEVKSRVEGDVLVLHPHFHGLTSAPAPKLFWQAVWGLVVGSNVITDARLIKGRKAISNYVSKYESKPEELPSGKGTITPDVARLWVEGALYNRQRLRVWGFASPKIKTPEMKLYHVGFAFYLTAYLNLESPLPDRFTCWNLCKDEGVDRIFLTRGSVKDHRFTDGDFEVYYEVSLYYDIKYGFILEGNDHQFQFALPHVGPSGAVLYPSY